MLERHFWLQFALYFSARIFICNTIHNSTALIQAKQIRAEYTNQYMYFLNVRMSKKREGSRPSLYSCWFATCPGRNKCVFRSKTCPGLGFRFRYNLKTVFARKNYSTNPLYRPQETFQTLGGLLQGWKPHRGRTHARQKVSGDGRTVAGVAHTKLTTYTWCKSL